MPSSNGLNEKQETMQLNTDIEKEQNNPYPAPIKKKKFKGPSFF